MPSNDYEEYLETPGNLHTNLQFTIGLTTQGVEQVLAVFGPSWREVEKLLDSPHLLFSMIQHI